MFRRRLNVAQATKNDQAISHGRSERQAFRYFSAAISVPFRYSATVLFICIRSFFNVYSLYWSWLFDSLEACLYYVTIGDLTSSSSGVMIACFLSYYNGHVEHYRDINANGYAIN